MFLTMLVYSRERVLVGDVVCVANQDDRKLGQMNIVLYNQDLNYLRYDVTNDKL